MKANVENPISLAISALRYMEDETVFNLPKEGSFTEEEVEEMAEEAQRAFEVWQSETGYFEELSPETVFDAVFEYMEGMY